MKISKWKSVSKAIVIIACLGVARAASAENIDLTNARQIKDPAARAEALSLIGERLVTPSSYMFAWQVFTEAKNTDPQNLRARFYLSNLAPAMLTKGLLKSVAPLVHRDSGDKNLREAYAELVQSAITNPSVKDFVLRSNSIMRNEADLQALTDRFQHRINANRMFLKSINTQSIVLHINENQYGMAEFWRRCKVTKTKAGYQMNGCGFVKRVTYGADGADIEALAQISGGLQIFATLFNAYDLRGFIDVSTSGYQTTAGFFQAIERQAHLGRGRRTSGLPYVLSLGADMVSSAKWAYKWKRSLCPQGDIDERNRPGKLFSTGICVPSITDNGLPIQRLFAVVEASLGGGPITLLNQRDVVRVAELTTDPSPTKASLVVKPALLFSKPIQNLRSILPNSFDRCDQIVGLKDPSIGGVAVNKNAPQFLRSFNVRCR